MICSLLYFQINLLGDTGYHSVRQQCTVPIFVWLVDSSKSIFVKTDTRKDTKKAIRRASYDSGLHPKWKIIHWFDVNLQHYWNNHCLFCIMLNLGHVGSYWKLKRVFRLFSQRSRNLSNLALSIQDTKQSRNVKDVDRKRGIVSASNAFRTSEIF